MDFNNAFEKLNSLCIKKNENAIMIKYNNKDDIITTIYFRDPRNLIVGINSNSTAWFLEKKDRNEVSTFIPKDIFERNKLIVYDQRSNSVQPFFRTLYNHLCYVDESEVLRADRKDIRLLIKNTTTIDGKIDEGEKPFFHYWSRKLNTSESNLEKTKRYFGKEIAVLCKKNNISSVWQKTERARSYEFLDLKITRAKLRQMIENKCEVCGQHLVLKTGINGRFLSCSTYPSCRYSKDI